MRPEFDMMLTRLMQGDMMKLIIQIPCLNEAETLPGTLAELPRSIEGFDLIEWLIIDDGSTDDTAHVARAHGVDHVVRHRQNKGLAAAFQTGLNACLERGADVIVNTDADNQYPGRYIQALVQPIMEHRADVVIGDRQTDHIEHFSPTKKRLQALGSAVVRWIARVEVRDAPSGFRAFTREAALRIHVFTRYTYTLETVIQAGEKRMIVTNIPITTNPKTRESRLIKSMSSYVMRSAYTMLRLLLLYNPLRSFSWISVPFFAAGALLWVRYLMFVLLGETGRGAHVQSVIVGSALLIIGFLIIVLGLVAEASAAARRVQEETLYYVKKAAYEPAVHESRRREVESDL